MTGLELRPLSLGEILDRTFSLYRRHFLLFMGIAGIPALLSLAWRVPQTLYFGATRAADNLWLALVLGLVNVVVGVAVYLLSQGATTLAVTDLYLGRSTTIGKAFTGMPGNFLSLLGAIILSFLAILAGTVCLVIPGIIVALRLFVVVPSTLVEDLGPADALTRSFHLTKDFAWRAFWIAALYFVLSFAIGALLTSPFAIMTVISAQRNPGALSMWTALTQLGSAIASTLITPILLIATSIYYFDLRIRKEAFDLQFMLDPNSERNTANQSVPSILS